MPAQSRKLWGLGTKSVLLAVLPVALTVWLLLRIVIPSAQHVMFDHEMTDLADETELRGWELADLIKELQKDYLSVARRLEEAYQHGEEGRDLEPAGELIRGMQSQYLRIEVLNTRLVDGVPKLQDDRDPEPAAGLCDYQPQNPSYRYVLREFLSHGASVEGGHRNESLQFRLTRADLQIRAPDDYGRDQELHVLWAGGHVIPPTAEQDGQFLLLALGLDEKLARMSSTPRHMTFVLDEQGHIILNPFQTTRLTDAQGIFRHAVEPDDEPFLGSRVLSQLQAAERRFSEATYVEPVELPLETTTEARQELQLPADTTFYFWESDDAQLEGEETTVALRTLRQMAVELALREWRRAGDAQPGPIQRVGGLSSNVAQLRLLASSKVALEEIRSAALERLTAAFQELPEPAASIKKLESLRAPIRPVECRSCELRAIRVSPSSDAGDGAVSFIIARAVFQEEVRAALASEMRDTLLWSIGIAVLIVAAALAMGIHNTRPLKRMTQAAQSVSTLTFDQTADDQAWERQVQRIGEQLPQSRRDEIGVLADAFQRMLKDVLGSQEALRDLNRDLERRVRLRTEELERANAELIRARDAAEQLSRNKDEFLANVSHELRTPLNWLYGAVQFLEMTPLDEQQQGDVSTIRKATEDLRDLIEDILDYQKIVMSGMSIERETVELTPLLEDVWDSLRSHADKFGSRLEFTWDDDLGTLDTDRKRLKQIVKNLAGNACKFKDPEGRRPNDVHVSARRNNSEGHDDFVLQVSDTGRGMKPDEQEKLFTRFHKLSSREGNSSGTGLGLVITKGLVELMGGTITFDSRFGRGTTFTVRLPAAPHDDQQQNHDRPAAAGAANRLAAEGDGEADTDDGRPHKVLVVDDDPNMRAMMQRYLSDHGYEVITAPDGVAALSLVKKESPDLITLDVIMPELDGWAVLAALKTDAETHRIPVIMTTTMDDAGKGYALGADDFLVKPVDWAQLAHLLAVHCGEEQQRVLIIDDDEQTRSLLRRQLESDDWTIDEATDGREALQKLQDQSPDAILLDLMMPEMDGFEFLLEFEKHPEWRTIPVIVVTAKDPTSDEVDRLRGSVARILQKGAYTHGELLAEIHRRVDRHLRRHRGAAAPAGSGEQQPASPQE